MLLLLLPLLWFFRRNFLLTLALVSSYLLMTTTTTTTISKLFVQAIKVEKVAVIGFTSKLGLETVNQLLDRGIDCNVLIPCQKQEQEQQTTQIQLLNIKSSPPSSLSSTKESIAGVKATIIPGDDISNVSVLKHLVQDCQACIVIFAKTRRSKLSDLWNHKTVENLNSTHPKQAIYQRVLNLLEACRSSKCRCKRIIILTEGRDEDPESFESILDNLFFSMFSTWVYEAEQALRGQTDIDYTIIHHPPGIVVSEEEPDHDNSSKQTYLLSLDDNGQAADNAWRTSMKYADIATLCVDCLEYYDYTAQTTLIATTTLDKTIGKSKWTEFLPDVQPDTTFFPKDMLEQHYKAVQNALVKIGIGMSFSILVVEHGILCFLYELLKKHYKAVQYVIMKIGMILIVFVTVTFSLL